MTATLPTPARTSDQLAAELTPLVSSATVIRRDEPLAKRTTLRVGGPADLFVEPASEADLGAVLSCNRDYSLIEGFNPEIELVRTQTIMQGAPCCTFRYARRRPAETSEQA